MVKKLLKGRRRKSSSRTGGIREKASSYLKHFGFKDVNQLHGGIINYAHQIEKNNELENKFLGKNFVFDDRLSERILNDVISTVINAVKTMQIDHVNCRNVQCNLLFIQCAECREKHAGCCTPKCIEIINLPEEEIKNELVKKIKKCTIATKKLTSEKALIMKADNY